MFSKLLRQLAEVYQGEELYIPDALYPLITDWLCKRHNKDPRQVQVYKWSGKKLVPYDEDKQLAAYQATPIHLPERILEKSIVIEASLESTIREEVKPSATVPKEDIVDPRHRTNYKPRNRRPRF